MTDTAQQSYDPERIETKWQARWASERTNEPPMTASDRPFYNLMMYPYPSAEGLHVGNVFAFVGADVYGRFQRSRGHTVFEPMGFDAFGIHSENYALKVGTHPAELIPTNINRFRTQLKRIGLMASWAHELSTTDPDYYKWTQWIFLQLYKAGLAYRKKAGVNWCPICKTVLANEQVINGFCERHLETKVEMRFLEQWFFRITDFSGRLLDNLERLDWSDSTRTLQRNWIGRSEGARITFKTPTDHDITVFTTRPDTIFGATFLVLAPEHSLVDKLTAEEEQIRVTEYQTEVSKRDIVSRRVSGKEKTGIPLGSYAQNPATGEQIPIWIADYVLMEYGTGAIMAVPGHDERDYEFATQHALKIVRVVDHEDAELPYSGKDGILVNSGRFDGLSTAQGARAITSWLEEQGTGQGEVLYRLHDWCVSRQRYWGPPIPIIYCEGCGAVPVPEDDLPVELPPLENFQPDDSGVSPLARHKEWFYVPCPCCGNRAHRETDVSDTFLDSAWYFLRYPSVDSHDRAFDADVTKTWLPVTMYIGGNEHAVLHLMYSRFITMALHDLGHLEFEEPFPRFRAHGLIVKDGAKMSKSRGNVVVPDNYIADWGADTFRMYLMFLGPYQEGGDFRDQGIIGIRRFLEKVWTLVSSADDSTSALPEPVQRKLHQTVRKVTNDVEALRYNTAISAMMEYVNTVREHDAHAVNAIEPLLVMLAPFAPHLTEECWERLGHGASIMSATWPSYDVDLATAETVLLIVQVNGKVRGKLEVPRGLEETRAVELALTDETVQRFLGGKPLQKTIYVPDRLVNLVV